MYLLPTCDGQGPAGDAVILVLLVWVGAPQAEAGEEGAKEVGEADQDDEGRGAANPAGSVGATAPGNGVLAEGDGSGGVDVDALLEETLPPAFGDDPLGRGRRRHHQKRRQHAAREGNDLKRGEYAELNDIPSFDLLCTFESHMTLKFDESRVIRDHSKFCSLVLTVEGWKGN